MAPSDTVSRPRPEPTVSAAFYDVENFESYKANRDHILVRNSAALREANRQAERTVVILGTGRSGTTMTAGVLLILGLEFGDYTDGRLGDRELAAAFRAARRSRLKWKRILLRRRFRKVMDERTRRWRRWAFKSPDLPLYLPFLKNLIHNPVYVLPTRNVFETSFGFTRNVQGSWQKSFFAATMLQFILTVFSSNTKRPVFIFSYEAALKNPARFVDVLCDFLDVQPDPDRRTRAIAYIDPTSGYQPIRRLYGNIDVADFNRVAGWVCDIDRQAEPVAIRVTAAGRTLATRMANIRREDVKALGYHKTGGCGFDITFPEPLSEDEFDTLAIDAPEVHHTFWRPGWQIPP